VGLLLAVELAVAVPRLGAAGEDGLQPLLHEGLADAVDGNQADIKCRADLLVGPGRAGGIGLEQDPGPAYLSGSRLALTDEDFQPLPLLIGQSHDILLVHRGCLPPGHQ
jgi:hypothetical protein